MPFMIFSKFPDIPLSFNFNNKPSSETLSKALDISRKTLSNHHKMTYKFHVTWLKSDCFEILSHFQ